MMCAHFRVREDPAVSAETSENTKKNTKLLNPIRGRYPAKTWQIASACACRLCG